MRRSQTARRFRPGRGLLAGLAGLALLAAAACQAAGGLVGPAQPVTLRFTYWGSPVEREATERMVQAFEAANPDIQVEALHYQNAEYIDQLSALFSRGTPPDVGYLFETYAPDWASQGRLLDLTDVFAADPELSGRLPDTYYAYAPGRLLGTATAIEIMVLFYNKALFDQAGVPYPPADPDQAWTWDEFIDAARRLTVDVEGNHPGDADFDPNRVVTFGVAFDTSQWYGYFPFIYSNGGEVVNEDGTALLLDSPEAIEAIQELSDLMWVHHVMPTPEQARSLPARDVMLQTGQLAMDIGGQWALLDYASMTGVEVGLAVLPKFQRPATIMLGSPTVIFAGTRHQEAAVRFYKFHNDPRQVDLYARGLWMPLQESYYTEPAAMASWLDNPAHPPEAADALVRYTLCCAVRAPFFYVRNFGQITTEVIQPAADLVWNNRSAALVALRQAVTHAQPLMAGRWDR
jgi:multiple sugar transport system substrate-binding protein